MPCIKAINQPYINSNYTMHRLSTGQNYTNILNNLQILHKTQKDPKLNTLEKFETNRTLKLLMENILNYQIRYKTHTLYDITHQEEQPGTESEENLGTDSEENLPKHRNIIDNCIAYHGEQPGTESEENVSEHSNIIGKYTTHQELQQGI